jgi:hypothetical protein
MCEGCQVDVFVSLTQVTVSIAGDLCLRNRTVNLRRRNERPDFFETISLTRDGDFLALRRRARPPWSSWSGVAGPIVKKRLDDRRSRVRFEIVGVLNGTLEVWQRCTMVNFSTGGALIESADLLEVGNRIDARLEIGGRMREVQSDVRRVATIPDRTIGKGRYQLGIEWGDRLSEDDRLVRSESVPQKSLARLPERRRSVRFLPSGRVEVSWPNGLTVELIDISECGVLVSSRGALPIGERGLLRLRLGPSAFVGEVEIRRVDARQPPRPGIWLGATFTTLDDANRGALDRFIEAGG